MKQLEGSLPALAAARDPASPDEALAALRALDDEACVGALIALAFPDRVAQRRAPPKVLGARAGARGKAVVKPTRTAYMLASGEVAALADPDDPLEQHAYLACADVSSGAGKQRENGAAARALVRLAAPVELDTLRAVLTSSDASGGGAISRERRVFAAGKGVQCREVVTLGSITLAEAPAQLEDGEAIPLLFDMLRARAAVPPPHGGAGGALRLRKATNALRQRSEWLRARTHPDLPDLSDDALMRDLDEWLAPLAPPGAATVEALLRGAQVDAALESLLTYDQRRLVDREAPARLELPGGAPVPLDYSRGELSVSVRLQRVLGMASHPRCGGAPVEFTLLSPADRPIQTTSDVPGFFSEGSYAEVRAELKGRYPKHFWPEDPLQAEPMGNATKKQREQAARVGGLGGGADSGGGGGGGAGGGAGGARRQPARAAKKAKGRKKRA